MINICGHQIDTVRSAINLCLDKLNKGMIIVEFNIDAVSSHHWYIPIEDHHISGFNATWIESTLPTEYIMNRSVDAITQIKQDINIFSTKTSYPEIKISCHY